MIYNAGMDISRKEKEIRIASEIMELAGNSLLVNLRFIDRALNALELTPAENGSLSVDGTHLFFSPSFVLSRFKQGRGTNAHDYLHCVFHCVFRHMYVQSLVDEKLWNLACDIASEYAIYCLDLSALSKEDRTGREDIFASFEKKGIPLTAGRLYHYLSETDLSPAERVQWSELFARDDHSLWYNGIVMDTTLPDIARESDNTEEGSDSVHIPEGPEALKKTEGRLNEEKWRGISEKIQMDLETFSKTNGKNTAGMLQSLREINRERYDYTEFLKKFAVLGEVMNVSDDEFDYIFYTYGLKLYGNLPLIEPLEYKEVKSIREFVIAIDTSASTSGRVVQNFVQKTYNILMSTESFFKKINLHIIQCDDRIEQDVIITSREDFDRYIETMEIRGLGGTDFRPVFHYVDKLIEQGAFSNLKGLIYFTDGWGVFPPKSPGYETAFVFLDDDYRNPEVPAWAIKLVLGTEEIQEG